MFTIINRVSPLAGLAVALTATVGSIALIGYLLIKVL
jgi:hypothetical protein